jgi:hypothetical protein
MNINELNKQLHLEILPDCLNYSVNQQESVDWSKLQYNQIYKSHEFFLNKFPDSMGLLNLPAGKEILQLIVDNAKPPIEEMEALQKEISLELIATGLDE